MEIASCFVYVESNHTEWIMEARRDGQRETHDRTSRDGMRSQKIFWKARAVPISKSNVIQTSNAKDTIKCDVGGNPKRVTVVEL